MSADPGPVVERPLDALVSFHYFGTDGAMAQLTDGAPLRLVADSGAFSAFTQGTTIRLGEYAAWLTRWRHLLFWAASLDVFGDPAATLANFRTLRDHHGLETVPTVHIGADPACLDVYAAEGVDFVALGGMVGTPRTRVLRWLVHVLRYARRHHPRMRFHAWGLGAQTLLDALPLYSVDSSGLLTKPYRFGTLPLWHPARRRLVPIALDGRGPHQHRRLLVETYRTPPSAILRSHPDNRPLLMRLAIRSAQLRARALQARHRLAAPRWAINPAHGDALTGTRVHAVDNNMVQIAQLMRTAPTTKGDTP